MIEDACAFFSQPTLPTYPTSIRGVCMSGGEFATGYLPGAYNTNYRYPSRSPGTATHIELDYHISRGAKVIRLPCRWERIQQGGVFTALSGEKDPAASFGGTAYDIARLDEIVAYNTSQGVYTLFDVHNYLRLNGELVAFNAKTATTSALADLWVRIATRYANNPYVIFGIMNEPNGNGLLASTVADIMTSVVNAIRSRTNALNRIHVEGTASSGGYSWISSGNAAAFAAFNDPANNYVVEIHQYFDSDSSGTSATCSVGTGNNLNNVTAEARSKGYRLFLGEFAGSDPNGSAGPQCGVEVPTACKEMANNTDVWCGWSGWGGGSLWGGTYMFRLDPSDYTSSQLTGPYSLIYPFL